MKNHPYIKPDQPASIKVISLRDIYHAQSTPGRLQAEELVYVSSVTAFEVSLTKTKAPTSLGT